MYIYIYICIHIAIYSYTYLWTYLVLEYLFVGFPSLWFSRALAHIPEKGGGLFVWRNRELVFKDLQYFHSPKDRNKIANRFGYRASSFYFITRFKTSGFHWASKPSRFPQLTGFALSDKAQQHYQNANANSETCKHLKRARQFQLVPARWFVNPE